MRLPRSATLTASVLAASLLLNVSLVSCASEPTAPPPADSAEILAKLAEVTAKLAAIEAKLDAQAAATADRLDSLEVTVTAAASGATPLPALEASRVDSILALASYIAGDIAGGSWEGCGKLEFTLGAKVGSGGEAKGEGKASVGAWAGTGAFAGALVRVKSHLEGEVGVALPFEFGYCRPLFGEPPPVRVTAMPGNLRMADAGVSNAIDGVMTNLGLSESTVENALGTFSNLFQSGSFPTPQAIAGALPLPPALAAKLADPVGAVQGEAAAKVSEAINMLCTGNWGSVVSGPITVACNQIASGSPMQIGGLVTMLEAFPVMQTTLTRVSGVGTALCSRLNTIGVFALTIPNPLNIGPTNLFGPQRLFPWYTAVTC